MRGEEISQRRRLLFNYHWMNRTVDGFAPRSSLGCRSAAIIEADHHISCRCRNTGEINMAGFPGVEDRLGRRLAVDVHKDRIFFSGIEMRRLQDECVEGNSIADIGFEEFDWRFEEDRGVRMQRGIRFEYSSRAIAGNLNEIGDRRQISARI